MSRSDAIKGDYESKRRLEVITEVVSGKFGMPVFIYEKGVTAAWYEKGRVCLSRFHLNELLKSAPDKCVKACVYHESGHAMLSDLDVMLAFSSEDGLKGICASKSEKDALRAIYNYLEDIRIEHAVASKYEGVQAELEFFMDRVHGTNPEMNAKSGINKLLSGVYLKSRYPDLAKRYIPEEIEEELSEFLPFGEKVKGMKNSKEVFIHACDMLKALREKYCPPDMPPAKEKGESGEGEGEESEDGDGEGGGAKGSSKGRKAKGGKSGRGKDSDGDAGTGDTEDESGEGDSSSSGHKDEGADKDARPKGKGWDDEAIRRDLGLDKDESPKEVDHGTCGHSDLPDADATSHAPRDAEGRKDEFKGDVEKKDAKDILRELEKEAGKGRSKAFLEGPRTKSVSVPPEFLAEFDGEDLYPILDNVVDVIEPYSGYSKSSYDGIAAELKSHSTTIIRKLKDLFVLDKKGRYHGGYSEGQKVDVSALTRVVTGDTRVFMKRFKESETDTAITLLVDQSGSMSGASIHQAQRSTVALAEVLTQLHVPFEVLGFSSYGGVSDRHVDVEEYRADNLRHWIFKSFAEEMSPTVKKRIGSLTAHTQNWDGEAMLWAYSRLKTFTAKNKFLWVLSDGDPAGNHSMKLNAAFTRKVIKCIEKKMDVVGIGFGSDHVKRYYKNYVVVEDIRDLTTEFIRLMRKCLL